MSRWAIKNRHAGFTIVELLIVIVVIGILAGLIFVQFNNTQRRARDAQRKSDIEQIVKTLEVYYSANGRYPSSAGGSTTINSGWSTTADSSWDNLVNILQPYAGSVPRDPISTQGGNPLSSGYSYSYFTNGGSITTPSYCGVGGGQHYILVYRLEAEPQKNETIGSCPSSPVGPYSGASNYRMVISPS